MQVMALSYGLPLGFSVPETCYKAKISRNVSGVQGLLHVKETISLIHQLQTLMSLSHSLLQGVASSKDQALRYKLTSWMLHSFLYSLFRVFYSLDKALFACYSLFWIFWRLTFLILFYCMNLCSLSFSCLNSFRILYFRSLDKSQYSTVWWAQDIIHWMQLIA